MVDSIRRRQIHTPAAQVIPLAIIFRTLCGPGMALPAPRVLRRLLAVEWLHRLVLALQAEHRECNRPWIFRVRSMRLREWLSITMMCGSKVHQHEETGT